MKVGDKIKCIKIYDYQKQLTIGKVYTIIEIIEIPINVAKYFEINGGIYFKICNDAGNQSSYESDSFICIMDERKKKLERLNKSSLIVASYER